MKLLWIFVFAYILYQAKAGLEQFEIPDSNRVLVEATVDVIKKFYSLNSKTVSVFQESSSSSRHHYKDLELLNQVLFEIQSEIVVGLETDNSRSIIKANQKRQYCIFFVDQYISFKKLFQRINGKSFSYQGFYLIVITKPKKFFEKDVEMMFQDFWSKQITNANVLVQNESEKVLLLTYTPYQHLSCGLPVLITLNTFQNSKFTEDAEYFPNKDENLNLCPVKVAVFDSAPFVIINETRTGEKEVSGIDPKILELLSNAINFTTVLKIVDRKGVLYGNGTATGAIKMTMDGEVDMTIGYFSTSSLMFKHLTGSYSYYTSAQKWIVPPGIAYNSFETMFLPFEEKLWICISITYLIAFLVITVINFFTPEKLQTFLFGAKQNPILNVVSITFGLSINKTPKRNFARYILALFMLYCFILRTAYSASLFKFMTSSLKFPTVRTQDEMVEKGFTFYVLESSKPFLNDFPEVIERSVFLPLPQLLDKMQSMVEPVYDRALLGSVDHVPYLNKHKFSIRVTNLAAENLFSLNLCFYLNQKSSLIDEVDKNLLRLTNHGFISKLVSDFVDKSYMKEQENLEAEPLNMTQMFFGFKILFFGWTVGLLAFFLEIVVMKFYHKVKMINFNNKKH